MRVIRTCTASTIPHKQASFISTRLHCLLLPLFAHVGYPSPISFTILLIILYFVTLQVCTPAFSLLVHDIMIPCLAAAGVLLYQTVHPSFHSLDCEQAFVPSALLYFDWSTLTPDRSDGDRKKKLLNLLSLPERAEFLCALLDTL